MIINSFNIDTSNVALSGASRSFNIQGDIGAKFSLSMIYTENPNIYYYNFETSEFQSDYYFIEEEITSNSGYSGVINFPTASSATELFLFLHADPVSGTVHSDYVEYRDESGNVDVNLSTGSNSLMLTKKIIQPADSTLIIATNSLSSQLGLASSTVASDSIAFAANSPAYETTFTLSITTANGKALTLDRQPEANDFFTSATVNIENELQFSGEDEFDNGQSARSTDTTSGATSGSTLVTMTSTVATKMAAGDRVTGTGISSSDVVTVVNITDGNDDQFRASQAVTISGGVTLTFTEPHYYRWEADDVSKILDYLELSDSLATANSYVSRYTPVENSQAVVKTGSYFTSTAGKIETIGFPGHVTFNQAQRKSFGNQAISILAYGSENIQKQQGWDLQITNLKATITKPTTVTTSGVSSSTSVPVASARGIMDDVSVVSSVNMDVTAVNPTVTNIASYNESSNSTATLTLSAAQTLENGETLTFDGAGQVVTITGNVEIIQAGTADKTIFFDIERLLSVV